MSLTAWTFRVLMYDGARSVYWTNEVTIARGPANWV